MTGGKKRQSFWYEDSEDEDTDINQKGGRVEETGMEEDEAIFSENEKGESDTSQDEGVTGDIV